MQERSAPGGFNRYLTPWQACSPIALCSDVTHMHTRCVQQVQAPQLFWGQFFAVNARCVHACT